MLDALQNATQRVRIHSGNIEQIAQFLDDHFLQDRDFLEDSIDRQIKRLVETVESAVERLEELKARASVAS